ERDALARPRAVGGPEELASECGHHGDAPPRGSPDEGAPLARRKALSLTGIRFLVLIGDGVDSAAIRAALPPAAPVHTAALRDAAVRMSVVLEDAAPDVALVASDDLNSMIGVIRD